MTFDPYAVWRVFVALRSTPNACNWCQGQTDENGVPPLMVVQRGHSSLAAHAIWGFSDPVHAIWWVAGASMQCGHFVCPSSCQKRENTASDLILRSAWGLSGPGKQVGRSSTPCRKRSQVWCRESERCPKYVVFYIIDW